jgi:hypothetical protein
MGNEFNAPDVLAAVRAARAVRRKRSTCDKSKLRKYLGELLQLKQSGATFADLKYWLRTEKRVKAERSTISRFLAKRTSTPEVEN